ncbi:MAG: hypothetical protein IZT55_02050 [Anaerolineae bacterium]|nr:hypothetical protein [Anaerolineae bacterium]
MIKTIKLLIVMLFMSPIFLSGCGVVPLINGLLPISQPEVDADLVLPPVFGPQAARKVGLEYVQSKFGNSAPGNDLVWVGGNESPGGLVGQSTVQYHAEGWSIQVAYPVVAPESIIYTVTIEGERFSWKGLIDAYGQAVTTTVSNLDPTAPPNIVDPTPTDIPLIGTLYYRDDFHKIAFEYPADWSLTEVSAGIGSDAKALRLQKGNWLLFIYYKLRWENVSLGGGLPAGDVVDRGWSTLVGRSVPNHFVVYDGKDKVMFYGDRFDDLDFYIRLEADSNVSTDYSAVDIPDHIVDVSKNIVANIIRTGEPISPPAPTATQIPPTPTPVPVPCNAVSFQSDITIQDGTVFAPNADFTKTWRIKNIGSCSWTTSYDLVFVEGSRMDGKKVQSLSEKVRPGETLDISIGLTSPTTAGDYRGYWMLRSDDGQWFGYGNSANKAFWADITVAASQGDFVYDFALNFCAATWRSDDMRLPCPGYTTSDEGFVQLLDAPKLENRNENELAIWAHPNEEKLGWIEGTYPFIEIHDGDHFGAWVGCLKGYDKCSLKFYLDYEAENGKVRRLAEWIEEYDGSVTVIDLDLSGLADETIRPILGVEALTKNVSDAQGFWFVPVISNQD